MVGKNDQFVIETFSLTKVFPDWWGRSKVVAVDDLELKVKKNEIYGLQKISQMSDIIVISKKK